MGQQQSSIREQSIPSRLPVWGYNSVDISDTDISESGVPGDLINLIGQNASPAVQNPVRFGRPYQGAIERAFLTFNFSYPGGKEGGGSGVYFGRGLFNDGSTGDLSDRQLVIDAEQIKADHKMITGSSNPIYPFTSNRQYVVERLDITKLIANRGEPALPQQYRDYAFIIVVMFANNDVPVYPAGGVSSSGWPYHLWDLRVEASALFKV